MVNQQQVAGEWNALQGKLRERWGALTDSDFQQSKGNIEALIGTIQRKTGDARERIESVIESSLESCKNGPAAETVRNYAQSANEYAHHAAEAVQQGFQQASEQAREGYMRAGQTVSRRPMESVAMAFGVGIISGVLVGLLFRGR